MKKYLLVGLGLILSTQYSTLSAQNERIEAASGRVIGMTSGGGVKGYGVLYGYNIHSGKDTLRLQFNTGSLDGNYPYGSLMQATNGMLYGMTYGGGTFNYGVLFMFNPVTKKDTVLVNFNGAGNGSFPNSASLMQASNGLLYGTTQNGGTSDNGVLFSYNILTHKDSVIFSFTGPNGAGPYGKLLQATDGRLYGMTVTGGPTNGTIYRYNPITNQDTVLLNLNDSTGNFPYGGLMQGTDGMLYGMTSSGSSLLQGVLFRYNPVTLKDTVLLKFNSTNGAAPNGSLMQASNGLLYGMTGFGGSGNNGVLFSYDPVLYKDSVQVNFNGGSNGWAPNGDLIQATNGLLYGMTYFGGNANQNGVFFSFNTVTGQDSVIMDFAGLGNAPRAGALPNADVMQASNGTIYGMTFAGGQYNQGVIFSYRPGDATDSTLHSFGSGGNTSNLVWSWKYKVVFGLTEYGGTNDLGTLFRYNIFTGKDTTLLNFNGTNGSLPELNNNVIIGTDGNLYGLTVEGGTTNQGTLFRFNPVTFADSVLVNFNGVGNGQNPYGTLLQANNGKLYGVAVGGGANNLGCIFRYDPVANKDTVIYNCSAAGGNWPYGTLMQATNGLLYGTTNQGGTMGYGTLYSINPVNNTLSTLVNFNDSNGGYPYGGLMQATDGMIYGLTQWGGYQDNGTLFRFNPVTNKDTVLYKFKGTDGQGPMGQLVEDSATGMLYGTTPAGGLHNYGVLFGFNIATYKDTLLLNFNDTNGANPTDVNFLTPAALALGVNELAPAAARDMVIVYPNPFRYVANVVFSNVGKHYVEVDDMNGKVIKYITANDKQCQITRDNMSTGLYIIKVYDSNKNFVSSGKIEVQ